MTTHSSQVPARRFGLFDWIGEKRRKVLATHELVVYNVIAIIIASSLASETSFLPLSVSGGTMNFLRKHRYMVAVHVGVVVLAAVAWVSLTPTGLPVAWGLLQEPEFDPVAFPAGGSWPPSLHPGDTSRKQSVTAAAG